MTTLKYLRHSILIACFLNLIFALTHWAGIASDHLLIATNYGLSALIILIVLLNTIVLTHHPTIMLPPATTNLADQLCCPTDCLSDRVVMSIVHIGCVLSSLIAN